LAASARQDASRTCLHSLDDQPKDCLDDDLDNGMINSKFRIQVNKNKKILDHLTKFSQDIDQFRDKEGMSLLFYDFNGFKSSIS